MATYLRTLLLSFALVIIVATLWLLFEQQATHKGSQESSRLAKEVTNYSSLQRQFQRKTKDSRQIAPVGETEDAMARAGTVKAQVVDEWGQPVSEGSIALFCADHGQLLPGPRVRLDEEGWFEAKGCSEGVCVEFSHPSRIQDGPWLLREGQVAILRSRSLASLQGTVRSLSGSPVIGAKLSLLDTEYNPGSVPPTVTRHTSSDLEGRYQYFWLERPLCDICANMAGRCLLGEERVLPVYEGELLLIVSAPGFRDHSQVVSGPSLEDVDVVLQPPEAELVGTLHDPKGKPYPRARVMMRSKERSFERHSTGVERGTFRFERLASGPYHLEARQDGVVIAELNEVYAGSTPSIIGLELVEDRSVLLQVRTANEVPVVGVELRGGPFNGQVTNDEGRAQASGVLPGKYSITAIGSSFPRTFQQIEVGREARVYQFDIQGGAN